MAQSNAKKFPKIYILAAIGILFPVFLVTVAFLAAQSDAKLQKEYDRINREQAEKFELQKQQQKNQQDLNQTQEKIES